MNASRIQYVVGVCIALAASAAGCGDGTHPPEQIGSIEAHISAAPSTVKAIHVVVTGDFTPIARDLLEGPPGVWTGTIDNVPVGDNRLVTAYAYDQAPAPLDLADVTHLIYLGATNVTVLPFILNPALITLLPFPPDGGGVGTNTAPHLISVTQSGPIAVNMTATLTATAIDPDDDLITYTWGDNGAGGSFAGGLNDNPTTIAPNTPVSVNYTPALGFSGAVLIQLTVNDPHGASTTTAFHLVVMGAGIDPIVLFDVLPVLTLDGVSEHAVLPGVTTQVAYTLTNPLGSGVAVLNVTALWTDTCGGVFGPYDAGPSLISGLPAFATVTYTAPPFAPGDNRCVLMLTITGVSASLSAQAVIWVQDLGKVVFVSSASTQHDGTFFNGSLANADDFCQNRALAGMAEGKIPAGTTYRAFLSTSSIDARDRLDEGPYVLSDGTLVATTKGDMLAWALLHAINTDEHGAPAAALDVFTGTNPDGTHAASNCLNWTSSDGADTGARGTTEALDDTWVQTPSPLACNQLASVYCFQFFFD